MQGKLCDLQPHLCDEQFPLQWQLTISMMAFGDGRSSVVCGTKSPLASLQNQFCNGSKNCCCAILACPHTLAWIWTRIMCFLSTPGVDGNLLPFAIIMFAEQEPSKCRNAVNLNAFLTVTVTHKRSKHSCCALVSFTISHCSRAPIVSLPDVTNIFNHVAVPC